MRIHYTLFLFFYQQAKPHAAIDALFSALLPIWSTVYAGIGDEFYFRQMMNTLHCITGSGVVSFCHNDRNDSIYLHRLRHRSLVWLATMALPTCVRATGTLLLAETVLYR